MAFSYEVLPGYFSEAPDEKTQGVQQVPPRFGLIDASPDRWSKFKARISELNSSKEEGTTFRVLFLGRHGQGFHNVAESIYGTSEWDRYWSLLNGDGNIIWGPDPKLTELGISQAKTVHDAWIEEIKEGIPLPESVYSSPLSRAILTCQITFEGILLDDKHKRPLIKEKLRETNGEHTCDKRNTRFHIEKTFPLFSVEEGFTEKDILWHSDYRETKEEETIRQRESLSEIFANDSATYISITAHGGALSALMRVINAPSRVLPTGGVVCFVVKVTRT